MPDTGRGSEGQDVRECADVRAGGGSLSVGGFAPDPLTVPYRLDDHRRPSRDWAAFCRNR